MTARTFAVDCCPEVLMDKPLNVRCAEALGWTRLDRTFARPPGEAEIGVAVPHYGDDTPEGWACTGPLLQRFHLGIKRWRVDPDDADPVLMFSAGRDQDEVDYQGSACAAIAEWVATYVENGEQRP